MKDALARLLEELVHQFVLLRDVFGYLLPGASLVFLGLLSRRIHVPWYLDIYKHPGNWAVWGLVIALVAASYLAGHIAAMLGYTVYSLVDFFRNRHLHKPERYDLHASTDYIYYRALHPEVFIESDRRETINLLRVTFGGSLVLSSAFFWPAPPTWMILVAGALILVNGYTGRAHVNSLRNASTEAAKRIKGHDPKKS